MRYSLDYKVLLSGLDVMLVVRLAQKFKTFTQQPPFILGWLLPCWFLLGLSRCLILTVSFKRLAPYLGIHDGLSPWIPLLDKPQEQKALLIGRTVRLAAQYTPWISNCFPQAITARLLLGVYRIPYGLYFGLRRDRNTNELNAHAWIATGRVRVTGGTSFGQFTVVGCFMSPLASDFTTS